jgi:DNA primase
VVTLPEGEDRDSFVDKYGGEKLTEQLSGAVDIFERKLNELERNGYFADLHRKRVAIDKLLPTLRATADGVTREIYLARASEVSGVSREVLEREITQMAPRVTGVHAARPPAPLPPGNPTIVERRAAERRRAPKPVPGIERSLVRILLHDRSQVEQIAEHIGPEELRDPALQDIYRALLAVGTEESLEVVAARLDPESEEVFAELQREPIGEGEEVQRTLAGSIARIRRTAVQRKMDEITRAMRIATPAEQDVLISEKRRLMDDLAALGGGSFKSFDRARHS